MKYIGVDQDGDIYFHHKKPEWLIHSRSWFGGKWIPISILPHLDPCCLYRIDKDCYTLIEDRIK